MGTDIVVAHGPPRGYGDRNSWAEHVGSTAMTAALERVQPQLMVCGHIHEGQGWYELGVTRIVNASLLDEDCRPVNPVIEVQLHACTSNEVIVIWRWIMHCSTRIDDRRRGARRLSANRCCRSRRRRVHNGRRPGDRSTCVATGPRLDAALAARGLSRTLPSPGIYWSADRIEVDPETLGGAGRRGARLGPHGNRGRGRHAAWLEDNSAFQRLAG